MKSDIDEAEILVAGREGRPVARVCIGSRSGDGRSRIDLLSPPQSAHAESIIQIMEHGKYDCSVTPLSPDLGPVTLESAEGLVKPSVLSSSRTFRGHLEPGGRTGWLTLHVRVEPGEIIGSVGIEVRSVRLSYRRDYRSMLDDIASQAVELLMSLRGATQAEFSINALRDSSTIGQQLAFVRAQLEGGEIERAIGHILRSPHELLRQTESRTQTLRGGRLTSKSVTAFGSARDRVRLPSGHPLVDLLPSRIGAEPSIPRYLPSASRQPLVDTPENRFVKFVLEWVQDLLQLGVSLTEEADATEYSRLVALRNEIAVFLAHDLFANVGSLQFLPAGSPVLQRRPGYREVLMLWEKLQCAAALEWTAAEDVFGIGLRRTAELYEYWVFFQLLDLVSAHLGATVSVRGLFAKSERGTDLELSRGSEAVAHIKWTPSARRSDARLYFNRQFPHSREEVSTGTSWSLAYRPDFSIELLQGASDASSAWLHFDAKYRVRMPDLLRDDSKRLERSLITKMHAYRDSLRGSLAAFVLYPGDDSVSFSPTDARKVSVGAVPLRPGEHLGEDKARIARIIDSFRR